jgi:adenylate cyclase
MTTAARLLKFDSFSIDLEAIRIVGEGGPVEVEPQVFALITLLASNPGRLVSHDEIIEKVWHGRIVSDSAIASRVAAARKALGDDGAAQRIIKTVRGRGFRFELVPTSGGIKVTAARIEPDKPSIAVMPFENLSGDPAQDYFSDGIVEDIIAGLSRMPEFFVIARNSTIAYKGKTTDARQTATDLGVRYVVEGSVRRSGKRVRLSCQLIDAASGHQVWASRFEGDEAELFDLQDRITGSLIGALQPAIRAAEIQRARRTRPDSVDVYDLYLQALPHVSALERTANAQALELLHRALVIDKRYPTAIAMVAWCHAQRCIYHWSDNVEEDSRRAMQYANAAVRLAENDPFALSVLGAAHSLTRQFHSAKSLLDRALALDPSCAWGWNRYGWLHGYLGTPHLSIGCFERAIELSPLDPMNFNCYVGIGQTHFIEGRLDEAIVWMEKGLHTNPFAIWIHRSLVPAYVEAGRLRDAHVSLSRLLAEYPDLTCRKVRAAMLYDEKIMTRICDGLEKAGLNHG